MVWPKVTVYLKNCYFNFKKLMNCYLSGLIESVLQNQMLSHNFL
jgi:hypothetical protein